MRSELASTPFGRRAMSLAHVANRKRANDRLPEATTDKWTVFRALCAARAKLNLSERSLAVLNALLSFHPEAELAGDRLVVFPSNAQLSLRAHGMPLSTMRRHLSQLVEAGVILRRDSPNGKRYARKGHDGEIDTAFGFDLAPLVARAAEFEALAIAVKHEADALRRLREQFSLARRDVVKLIACGLAGGEDVWTAFEDRYRELIARIPRHTGIDDWRTAADDMAKLAAEILNLLETQVNMEISSANESRNERHIQDSQHNLILESEPLPSNTTVKPCAGENADKAVSLQFVFQACPDILDYSRDRITNWRDFIAAGEIARRALGVSPSAIEEARAVMGEPQAAVVIAAILQRGEKISNSGGYLRELTRKSRRDEFSVRPMLTALIAARRREDLRSAPRRVGDNLAPPKMTKGPPIQPLRSELG